MAHGHPMAGLRRLSPRREPHRRHSDHDLCPLFPADAGDQGLCLRTAQPDGRCRGVPHLCRGHRHRRHPAAFPPGAGLAAPPGRARSEYGTQLSAAHPRLPIRGGGRGVAHRHHPGRGDFRAGIRPPGAGRWRICHPGRPRGDHLDLPAGRAPRTPGGRPGGGTAL